MKNTHISPKRATTQMQDILRLKHTCITTYHILLDENMPEHRRIELALEHLKIVQ